MLKWFQHHPDAPALDADGRELLPPRSAVAQASSGALNGVHRLTTELNTLWSCEIRFLAAFWAIVAVYIIATSPPGPRIGGLLFALGFLLPVSWGLWNYHRWARWLATGFLSLMGALIFLVIAMRGLDWQLTWKAIAVISTLRALILWRTPHKRSPDTPQPATA